MDKEKKKGGRIKVISNCLFIAAIMLVTLLGLTQTLLFPDEVSEAENRYANKVAKLTAESYLNGSFQSSMDNALGDQVTFSSTFKKVYNKLSTEIQNLSSRPVLSLDYFKNRYLWLDNALLFNMEYLVYNPYSETRLEEIDGKIEHYNAVFEKYSDIEFFLYYIEKDTDINFETGVKVPFYDKLRENLTLDEEHMAKFEINGFDEFSRYFYKTDHHWNHIGSYKGYTEVMELLGCDEALIEPGETVKMPGEFSGSKATSSGAMYSEPFTAYRFEYPAMTISENGAAVSDYGNQNVYMTMQEGTPTYGSFYGGDAGEVVFSTNRPERENVMIIGESYDNAILKLIASHFDTTISVDLRYYEGKVGKPFSMTEYLEQYDIDKVLLIGNVDYFILDEFMIGE